MSNKEIAMIVAMDETCGITRNGKIPKWKIKDDLYFFRTLTTNNTVIMGANTYYSINKSNRPLSSRYNIVITRDPEKHNEFNSFVKFTSDTDMDNLTKELPFFYKNKIFVIGGADIYNLLGDQCNTLYITIIKGDYDCDIKLDIAKFTSNFKEKNILVEKANYKIVKYSKPKNINRYSRPFSPTPPSSTSSSGIFTSTSK
jgi:dihydrofolate reductase